MMDGAQSGIDAFLHLDVWAGGGCISDLSFLMLHGVMV